jgi:peptide chain release factor 1
VKKKVPAGVAEKMVRRREDFEIQTFRAGGKGGQNQNKRDTGVRIIDRATGLRAESRKHSTQEDNRKAAFLKLVDRMVAHYKVERFDGSSDEVVRSYKFPSGVAVDHGTGRKSSLKQVMDGEL